MADIQDIPRPPRLDDGTYHPEKLLGFLDECAERNAQVFQIAAKLKVSAHRIIYFQGAGRRLLEKAAFLHGARS